MTFKERWNAEETKLGAFVHKYVSIALLAAGAAPEILIWAGTLPQGTVPQNFWTVGLILGSLAKIGGKLTVK